MVIYTIENNVIDDLRFMKNQILRAQQYLGGET